MRILIANAWSDSAKGDTAILLGTCRVIRDKWPDAEIELYPLLSERSAKFDLSYVMTEYGATVLPSANPMWFSQAYPAVGPMQVRLSVIAALFTQLRNATGVFLGKQASSKLLLHGAAGKLLKAVDKADLVILRGGGYLSSESLQTDLLFLYTYLFPALLSQARGVPYAILGHSVWNLDGPFAAPILSKLIRGAVRFTCRERLSFDYLLSRGVSPNSIAVAPDFAFGVKPHSREYGQAAIYRELETLPAKMLGVTVRSIGRSNSKTNTDQRQYLKGMAELLIRCRQELGLMPVLMPQNLGPTVSEDDTQPTDILHQMLGSEQCLRLRGSYHPAALSAIYGCCEALLTTRLHAAILASLSGTPSVAFEYVPHKTQGILHELGMGRYVLPLNAVSTDQPLQLLAELLANLPHTREILTGAADNQRARLSEHFYEL